MKTAVFAPAASSTGHLLIEDVPRPKLKPGYMLIRVAACGVCRTDLHIIEGDLPAIQPQLIRSSLAGV